MAIKVFIQTQKFKGGPAVFRDRLIKSLNKFDDIEVATDINKKFDIELAFIRKIFKHNKPYILRLDGCYYEENRKSGNRGVEKAILGAKYLIFQSNFSFQLLQKVLNISEKINEDNYSIIHNGIDLNYINKIEPSNKIEPGSFVTCAKWRPNKRPKSTIKGFLEANIGKHLYIIGDEGIGGKKIDKKYESKYIHVLNKKSNEKVISIMKACDYQLHLCHIDSCPNIVLEGLCSGLNVLCSNLGGTKELVQSDGIVLKADKMWGGRYLKPTNLDNIKSTLVAEGIHKLIKRKTIPDSSKFDINLVVKKYVDIIRNNI